MDDLGALLIGYGLVLSSLGVYTWRLLARGRRLAARVPDEDKPWI